MVNDLSLELSRVRALPSPTSLLISANVRSPTPPFPAKYAITASPLSTNGFPENCKVFCTKMPKPSLSQFAQFYFALPPHRLPPDPRPPRRTQKRHELRQLALVLRLTHE